MKKKERKIKTPGVTIKLTPAAKELIRGLESCRYKREPRKRNKAEVETAGSLMRQISSRMAKLCDCGTEADASSLMECCIALANTIRLKDSMAKRKA